MQIYIFKSVLCCTHTTPDNDRQADSEGVREPFTTKTAFYQF